eukprot:comp12534_c0_seq1/m.7521 comp12534_c0_seq1/g.7521  ORF comp12534_c0_seq1/g.7521 comp12534_c0_seq1/m.7521 type:complete len:430 (-) comp12534_c0_seq1:40-1329(-)
MLVPSLSMNKVFVCLAACLVAAHATSPHSHYYRRETTPQRSVTLKTQMLDPPENATAIVRNTYSSNNNVIKVYEVSCSWDPVKGADRYRFCFDSLDLWRREKCIITENTTYNNGDSLYLVEEIEGRFANPRVRAENSKGGVSEYAPVKVVKEGKVDTASYENFCSKKSPPEFNSKSVTFVGLSSGKLVTTQADVEIPVKVTWKLGKGITSPAGFEVCVGSHDQEWAPPPILTIGNFTCVLAPSSARSVSVPVVITKYTEYLAATVRPLNQCQDMGVSRESEWIYPRQLYAGLNLDQSYDNCTSVSTTNVNGTSVDVLGGSYSCSANKSVRFLFTNNMDWNGTPFKLEIAAGKKDRMCIADQDGYSQIVECDDKAKNQRWRWVYEQRAKKWVRNEATGHCMTQSSSKIAMVECKERDRTQWFTFPLVPLV